MFTFDEKDGSADDQELSALFAQAPCVELTDPVVAIEPVKPRPSKKTLEEALDAESLRDKNPKISQKSRSERQKAQEEARAKAADRTLFIGNLPSAILSSGTSKTLQKALHRSFSVFGSIESIRYRSIAFDHSAKNKKAAFLKGQFHAEAEACNAYLVYKGKESVSTAIASMNGLLWEGRHLRVDSCLSTDPKAADKKVPSLQPITKQCVFVGNLSFDASDEDLWGFFEDVGDIDFVRIIRDRATSVGKGFAYVQFKDSSSVPLALKLNGKLCLKRELRITRCKKDSITSPGASSYEGTRAKKNDKSLLDKKGRPMTGAQLRLATKAPRPPKNKSAKAKSGSKPGQKPGSNKAKKAQAQKKAETKVMKKVKSIAKKNKQAKKA